MMNDRSRQYHPMKNAITKQQSEAIDTCLSRLADKLRVTAVLMVNAAGHPLAEYKREGYRLNTTLISTLTAGTYAATRETARIVGEKTNFKMVLHEGEKQNLFVSSIDGNYFIIVVFENVVALGMVRLFVKKTVEHLLVILNRDQKEKSDMDQIFSSRFRSQLDRELDRSLKEFE